MKKKDIKVEASSDYWSDFEGELSVYGFFKWRGANCLSAFTDRIISFTWEYIKLSQKYGIAQPVKSFENIHHFEMEYMEYKSCFEDERKHNPMLFIQVLKNSWLFPSVLFVDVKKPPESIVCIDPWLRLEEVKGQKISHSSSMPLKVALDIGTGGIDLWYYLDNDIFNLGLENKKCREVEYLVDNSDLAYLNTPRLNSFLRDLKKLCFEYGATDFEFENLGLDDFTEKGVLFNNEIVYYEDIVDILEPHQRIVK